MEDIMANKVHDIWAHWMDYVFSKSAELDDGSVVIPKGLVDRWKKQINTPYEALTEQEKQSDRVIAAQILKLFERND